MQATILLADDNSTTRSTLKLVLEKRLEVKVRGEAASLAELAAVAGEIQADLLILNWDLPGFQGAESLKELCKLAPGMKVAALSARPEARGPALAAGADAFVCMGEQPEALFQTVQSCCRDLCSQEEGYPKD